VRSCSITTGSKAVSESEATLRERNAERAGVGDDTSAPEAPGPAPDAPVPTRERPVVWSGT